MVPPITLQTEFAKHVARARALESAQATSRARLDALFQSMLHRAFEREFSSRGDALPNRGII